MTFAGGTTRTITRTSGSFITDGFAGGQRITTTNPSNPGPFTVAQVSATVITTAENLTAAGPASTTITAAERVPTVDFEGDTRPTDGDGAGGAQVDAGYDEAPASSATLHVIKHVVNDNGGGAVAANWTLTVSSNNGGSGTGNAAGAEAPGTMYTLQAGKQYSVAESGGPTGYSESDSADCVIPSAVAGTSYTCTITNDDIAPQLHVIKHVVNDNGGGRSRRTGL